MKLQMAAENPGADNLSHQMWTVAPFFLMVLLSPNPNSTDGKHVLMFTVLQTQ